MVGREEALCATSLPTGAGARNPFRYRGYYYDAETSLYYLQSRYYDPEVGRFVNEDDIAYLGATGTAMSCNLFAYCENNSVMSYDPNGTDAIWLQDKNNVYGFGHTGLLIQDACNTWWHFYWGNNRDGFKGKTGEGVQLLRYSGKISLSAINSFYKKNYDGSQYEAVIYFKGNFSKSYVAAKKAISVNYNLILNNCMQTCTDVLMQGTFFYNSSEYKKLLISVRSNIIPNIAFNRVLLYTDIVNKWYSTPYYLRSLYKCINPSIAWSVI